MTSILGYKANRVKVSDKDMHSSKKGSTYEDVLSHVKYEEHGKITTRNPWCTNEFDGILPISPTEKVYAFVLGRKERKMSDDSSET